MLDIRTESDKLLKIDAILSSSVDKKEQRRIVRFLAKSDNPLVVDILLKHLDLKVEGKTESANALYDIGEKAVPQLMKYIQSEKDVAKLRLAVRTVAEIKGEGYDAFVRANYDSWSPQLRYVMLRYATNP